MQALGNDFVIIDATEKNISLSRELICKVADRYFGVGCDQVLILELPTTQQTNVDFAFRVFNADGSEAGQCGNGLRCLAKFVVANGLSQKKDLIFASKSCKTQTHIEDDGQITVTLSRPIFEPKDIPFVAEKKALRYNLSIAGYDEIEVGVVSVGNPHAVVLLEDDAVDCVENFRSSYLQQ